MLFSMIFCLFHFVLNFCAFSVFFLITKNLPLFCWSTYFVKIKFEVHVVLYLELKKVDLWTQKSGLFESNPLYKKTLLILRL